MSRVAAAGLPGFKEEQLFFHVHAHLDIFVDGQPVTIPQGIGIGGDPKVRYFTYQGRPVVGAPQSPCRRPCVSPLHTHDASGILHVENDKERQITLEQFFTEWGVRFTPDCVGAYCAPEKAYKVYVGGKEYTGDPTGIVLKDQEEIALVIGTPPTTIPSKFPTG